MMTLKTQNENLLSMKMGDNYLNFVYHIAVKAKSNYNIFF